MNRNPTKRRVPAALLLATLATTLMLGACKKPGDGASGVNPPSGTRASDQAPAERPRQP